MLCLGAFENKASQMSESAHGRPLVGGGRDGHEPSESCFVVVESSCRVSQVLLEVLTGRRALQTDRRCGDRYLVRAHTGSQSYRQTGRQELMLV